MSKDTKNILKVKSYLQNLTAEEVHVVRLSAQKFAQKLIIDGVSEFKHAFSNILLESKMLFDESKIYMMVGAESEIINTSLLIASIAYLLKLDADIINDQEIEAILGYLLSAESDIEISNTVYASLTKRLEMLSNITLQQTISAQLSKILTSKINDYQTMTIADMSPSTICDLVYIIV